MVPSVSPRYTNSCTFPREHKSGMDKRLDVIVGAPHRGGGERDVRRKGNHQTP